MTARFLCALFLASSSLSLAAQQPSTETDKKPATPRTVTLTGCVEKGQTPNFDTVQDEVNGKARSQRQQHQQVLGKRVEIAGVPGSTRLRVKGGLWPTPNVAGQAGAIDPAKAAIAAQPGGGAAGTGDVDLPTLKVKSVRTLDGGCK
ncbi:MAG: hypothetical protein U0Q11_05315 [Vicinamibacterales bacterium]